VAKKADLGDLSEAPPIDLGTKRNESSRTRRPVDKRLTEVSFGPQLSGSASVRLVESKGACHDAHYLRPADGKARYDHTAREAPALVRRRPERQASEAPWAASEDGKGLRWASLGSTGVDLRPKLVLDANVPDLKPLTLGLSLGLHGPGGQGSS
jgi:hypothetical protein